MSRSIDHTHDAAVRSRVPSANADGTPFPIQNLPLGVFRREGGNEAWRGGVALGDQVIDLAVLAASGVVTGAASGPLALAARPTLNDLLAAGPQAWLNLRHALFDLFRQQATTALPAGVLVPQADVEHAVPMHIGGYTDFLTSFHHSLNAGRLFDVSDVTPNFRWLPIGYHGRSSSVGVSPQRVRRPLGQYRPPGAEEPVFGPCAALDYELELGLVVGPGNALGDSIPLAEAERHLFGVCLLNDWSARDIQGWEMAPLGPFLGKNFATTISPWIVTFDALAPYRCPWPRDASTPKPLPYLDDPIVRAQGGLDVRLQVDLETALRREAGAAPARLSETSFRHQYWTPAQMVAHHTIGGCNLQPGDLLGTGTISGPTASEAGSILELTQAGRQPLQLPPVKGQVEQRGFLADGDTVVLRGWCEAPGRVRIGFGECRGTVLPARSMQ
ncbi:MAG: fumarylacetoacetase [Pigmentiphaga sp.]|uniref:fumarylacetoacetase n=1 Tax=Pigmentiphaga sp. TaxID=1977564 RepID=UPI003B57309F